MIAEQGHVRLEQLTLVRQTGAGRLAAQFAQRFLFGFSTHIVVHVG